MIGVFHGCTCQIVPFAVSRSYHAFTHNMHTHTCAHKYTFDITLENLYTLCCDYHSPGLQIGQTVKPVLSGHSKNDQKLRFRDRLSLNAGQKYCRILQESLLQYFKHALSYHLSLRPLFCLFLSGRLRQVLLYSLLSIVG